jgi:hypothetical protein
VERRTELHRTDCTPTGAKARRDHPPQDDFLGEARTAPD